MYFCRPDGHFQSAEDIECADDLEALKKARQPADSYDVELWQAGRFIVKVTTQTG